MITVIDKLLQFFERLLELILFLGLSLPILVVTYLIKLIFNCFIVGFMIGIDWADRSADYLFTNDKE